MPWSCYPICLTIWFCAALAYGADNSKSRTVFIEGQGYVCQTNFFSPLRLMSFDYMHNELFVGTEDEIYEVAGYSLSNAVHNKTKDWLKIENTRDPFNIEVLKYHNKEVIICGSINEGSCFRTSSNIKFPIKKASKTGLKFGKQVFSNLHKDHLVIANGQGNNAFPLLTIYDIRDFSAKKTIPPKSDANTHFVGSFFDSDFFYFVINRDGKSRILRMCNKGDSNGLVELKLSCEKDNQEFTHVLDISFSEGKPPSKENSRIFMTFKKNPTSSEGAFCFYELGSITREFQSAVLSCLDQPTDNSPLRISQVYPDSLTKLCTTQGEVKSSDLCHKGSLVIYSDSVIKNLPGSFHHFTEGVPTALLVTHINKDHVAFLAFSNSMIKLKVQGGKVEQYTRLESPSLDHIKEMLFDSHMDLFILKKTSVCKVEQAMCRYNDCSECVSDPHCGWCVNAKKKCTLKVYCDDLLWMPSKCPVIKAITPSSTTVHLFKDKKFSLTTNNLPMEYDTAHCHMEQQMVSASLVKGDQQQQIFSCDNFDRKTISSAYENVSVSLLLNGIEWGSANVSVYDCGRFSSCMDCLIDVDKFPCFWCVSTHKCQNRGSPCTPTINKNEKVMVETMEACPHILPLQDNTFHSGSNFHYRLKGVHLFKSFSPVMCRFQIEGEQAVVVQAQVQEDSKRDTVVCQTTELSYKAAKANSTVAVDLLTHLNHSLDNPQHVTLTLYKCHEMAKSCGKCGPLEQEHKCVWCLEEVGEKGRRNFCSHESKCKSSIRFQDTCPNPKIMKFAPPGGPVKGGTKLIIEGENLGKNWRDVEVFVGGLPCAVEKEEYVMAERIVCRVKDRSMKGQEKILVRVGQQHNSTATKSYHFNDHTVTNLQPSRGIRAGGTIVTINGNNLDYGTTTRVFFGPEKAFLVSRAPNNLVVQAPPISNSRKVQVRVRVDLSNDKQVKNYYNYDSNPTNLDCAPNESLLSGGSRITIRGKNLDLITNASLQVHVSSDQVYTSKKCHLSSGKLICRTPAVPLQTHYNDRRARNYKVKFQLDNYIFPTDDNDDFKIKFYNDPEFQQLPSNAVINQLKEPFEIKFKNGSRCDPEMVNEVVIDVGGSPCGDVTCSKDDLALLFIPAECSAAKGGKKYDVKVLFNNFKADVGTLNFPHKGVRAGFIIGLVLGILVAILVVLLLFFCLFKRRRTKPSSMNNRPPGLDTVNNQTADVSSKENPYNSGPGSNEGEALLDQDYLNPSAFLNDEQYLNALLERLDNQNLRNAAKEIYIARERLELGNQLGKGHFGKVHAATLRDADLKNPSLVAVKTIDDPDMDQKMIEGFLKEGVIMKNFNHPHVLNLIGLCLGYKKEPMVVLPFMANGDLRSYVKDKKRSFTARQLLKLAQQVAEGMSYLASLNFIHRDLAARNCMIDDKSQVKVADFGLSHQLHDSEYYSSKNRKAKLPIKWMALESLENYVFTTKSDVWSFGVLLWELMTRGVTPYPDVDVFETRNYLATGRRLYKPKFCPDNVYTIMTDCWQELPERRPTFTDLVNRIEVLLNPPRTKNTDKHSDNTKEPTYINVKDEEYIQDYLKPKVAAAAGDGGGDGGGRVEDGDEDESSGDGENVPKVVVSESKKSRHAVEASV